MLNDLVNSSTDTFFCSYESGEHEKPVNIEYQKLQIHREGTLLHNKSKEGKRKITFKKSIMSKKLDSDHNFF